MNRNDDNVKKIDNAVFMKSVKEMLNKGFDVDFTVTGNSMWPFLSSGRDRIIVEKYDKSKMKKGDIILFEPMPGKYLLHRIIKIDGDNFKTAGDGNCFSDGIFPCRAIIARVSAIIRKSKKISVDSFFYKFAARIWMLLFPIRKPILKFLISVVKAKK